MHRHLSRIPGFLLVAIVTSIGSPSCQPLADDKPTNAQDVEAGDAGLGIADRAAINDDVSVFGVDTMAAVTLDAAQAPDPVDAAEPSFDASGLDNPIPVRLCNQNPQDDGADLRMGIARISISKTGAEWLPLVESIPVATLLAGGSHQISLADIAADSYEGVKLELEESGVTLKLADGSSVQSAQPRLAYEIGGMSRCASDDNGFNTGDAYFLFSTRNGALAFPIDIGVGDTRALVFMFQAEYTSGCSNEGTPEIVLTAWVRYTGFTE